MISIYISAFLNRLRILFISVFSRRVDLEMLHSLWMASRYIPLKMALTNSSISPKAGFRVATLSQNAEKEADDTELIYRDPAHDMPN